MSFRPRIGLIVMLVVVAVGVWVSAQVRQPRRVDPPVVHSGSDIGFRVEAHDGTKPIGQLVVRINGQWVEVQFGGNPLRLGTQ
jgi:hypothetical protein